MTDPSPTSTAAPASAAGARAAASASTAAPSSAGARDSDGAAAAAGTPREHRVLIVEHEANAGAGLIGRRLEQAGIGTHTVGPEIGREVPATAEGFDGVIVLGGVPGPTDDAEAPWLPRVRELICWSLETQTPFLGVCLGAQMLAHVAGGAVGPVRQGAEVGIHEVGLLPAARGDELLGAAPQTLRAVQWHWLEITDLPPGAERLAESRQCPNQAFRVGPRAWGVQFHLEAQSPTVADWARGDREDITALGLTSAGLIAEAEAADASLEETWAPVIDRWTAVVRQHAATRVG